MIECGNTVFGTVTDPNPVVQTNDGKVMGENRDGIAIFRGIPYGGDMSGANRFQDPSLPGAPWPPFTTANKETFINDNEFSVELDPCKPYRELF